LKNNQKYESLYYVLDFSKGGNVLILDAEIENRWVKLLTYLCF